jgi:Amt family ammonium transporter
MTGGAPWAAASVVLCLCFIALVPLASAGLALINTGLGRSRSAAHCLLASLAAVSVATVVYVVCGFSLQGYPGYPSYVVAISGKPWDVFGGGRLFFGAVRLDGSAGSLAALLGMLSAGLAALIPLGAGADRWRLGASCVSSAFIAGISYPIYAHWVWGGGWLAQLGANYGLGHGFIDAGGAAPVQVAGGLTALSMAWILGPRRGKFSADGIPSAIPGHNAVVVLFACLIMLIGWTGLNSAGAMLFSRAEPGQAVLAIVNTALCATSAILAALATTRIRFGKPDASLCANAWVGGLAASSAGCANVAPAASIITGAIAGALVVFGVEWLETRLHIDDPSGAISVHAGGGIWGVLAAGIFDRAGAPGQFVAQLIGVATLFGFIFPLTYGLNLLLDRFYRQRVDLEGERQGMDLYELGAGAYPEFVTHREEFLPR